MLLLGHLREVDWSLQLGGVREEWDGVGGVRWYVSSVGVEEEKLVICGIKCFEMTVVSYPTTRQNPCSSINPPPFNPPEHKKINTTRIHSA